ncbi:ATP-binding protein [Paraburkholderia sp. EG287A]|uniref:ATP-binding protein n=1 Tax=unclassified Paraburkholderia TaxID=2615204 RepID=UPI0034D15E59
MEKGTRKRYERLYPDELLEAPITERLQFFHDSIVSHRIFDSCSKEIDYFISGRRRETMIMLIGASGAGKSALAENLHVKVCTEFFQSHPDDLHTIPSVLAEPWAEERDRFDWIDLYEELLAKLQAPLISDSLPEVVKIIAGREFVLPDIATRNRPTLRTLRQRFRRVIVERDTSVVFLDEATNVMLSEEKKRVKRRATTLRSMVNRSNTLLVCCGAYDLYDLALQSGQLARRGNIVHLRTYLPSERDAYGQALIALENCLPCKIKGGTLDRYADLLEAQSVRSVGHTKTILMNALTRSCNLNKPIDKEILERSFYKPEQLAVLRDDIFDGYLLVEGVRHPEDDRAKRAPSTGKADSTRPKARKKRPVGKVLPIRRPVGGKT